MKAAVSPRRPGSRPTVLATSLSVPAIGLVCALVAVGLLGPPRSARAAPDKMSREDIVKLGKTVVGFSYWWGGSKWKPGSSEKGKCTPKSGSSGCPNCTHSGSWGADCSGFVGKAWQVAVPKSLETAYHPYSTLHFTNNTTWWNKISRSETKMADAYTYNTNGAGHIFLYEKGDPWGNVWAWECKGCAPGCVYNLRPASSNYGVRQRKLLSTPPPVCTAKCSGSIKIDAKCGQTDCAKSSAKCVNDSKGLRCASLYCPTTGAATTCLPDGRLGSCKDGILSASQCSSGKQCVKLSGSTASCVTPCPKSCDDGNPCTKDACDAAKGTCTHAPQSGACWSGNKCVSGQTCAAGKCSGGAPAKNCDDANPCSSDGCDPATGACTHGAVAGNCSDGDACTVGDACQGGVCKAGQMKGCDDKNPCTADSCVKGVCQYTAAAGACDDGDACTEQDACKNKACAGVPKSCDDGKDCTVDTCVSGECKHNRPPAPPVKTCKDGAVVSIGPCGEVLSVLQACGSGQICEHAACKTVSGADAGGGAGMGSGPGTGGTRAQDGGANADLGSAGGGGGGGVALTTHAAPAPSSGCSGSGRPASSGGLLAVLALTLLALRRRGAGLAP